MWPSRGAGLPGQGSELVDPQQCRLCCKAVSHQTTDVLPVPQEDDDIEEGDLPEHKRAPPPIDFSKVDPSKPEELLKLSKKGKTLMVFATVSGEPTEKETEEITGLWQGSLFNANFDIQRSEVNLLPSRRV